MSTSKGWGRACSSASTPCTPSSRSPAMMMRSIGGSGGRARAGEAPVDRGGAELTAGELLHEHDGVRAVPHDTGEEQVAGEHAEEPLAELLVVDEDSLVGIVEPFLQRRVDQRQPVGPLVVATER